MDTTIRSKRRHRIWPEALKREIVAAACAPGASVSIVARQYDVNANMIFAWRKLYGFAPVTVPSPQLVPVMVTPDRPDPGALAPPALPADSIEIEHPRGWRVRIGPDVKASLLRLVLDALERR